MATIRPIVCAGALAACAANGMADLDHSALVRALELMAKHAVAEG